MTVLMTVWGPADITRWVLELTGFDVDGPLPSMASGATSRAAEDLSLLETEGEAQVKATLTRFASLPSRIPGYPGSETAAQYVRARFEAIGLERVAVDTFQVTVPVDKGGVLLVEDSGERLTIHSLWPNQVRTSTTPPEGIRGLLIDGGHGSLAEFDGKVVDGSVVLMGFGCGKAYLNARALGAAAILFYDDGYVSRQQALDKFLEVPVNIPRFWLNRVDAERLLQRLQTSAVRVALNARMDWETVPAYNILGYLPGLDEPMPGDLQARWKDNVIVLSAHYDAISVVPALAPGAENACGITALLHLAEVLSQRKPHYSILFLATSGHFEGLAGVNDFLYKHARKSEYFRDRMENPIDFRLFISLDLSSQNDQVAAFSQGTFYSGWATDNYVKNLMAPYARRFHRYVAAAFPGQAGSSRFIDAVAPSKQAWKDFMPVGLALDSEAPVFVGLSAISLVTPDDLRRRVDTPLDRLEHTDTEALARQIQTIGVILLEATRDPGLFGESALQLKDQGHSLAGQIYWFNREVHFAVPKDPIPGAVVTYQHKGGSSIAGVRTLMVTETNSAGRFRFDILRNTSSNRILAYKLGEAGQIEWAPDLGGEGSAFSITQDYVWWEDEMVEVLFRCRSLELFEMVDSRQLVALDLPTVLGENDAPLQWYGQDFVTGQSQAEGTVTLAGVLYAKAGTRVKILMGTGLLGIKYLLTNAPQSFLEHPISSSEATPELLEEAEGRGYLVDEGTIRYPLLRSTIDMWVIDDVRMKILAKHGVLNDRVARLHDRAREDLNEAREALDALEYERFQRAVRRAAGYENRAYPDVKATANDTVNGVVFYLVLLVPFCFFAERLLFGFADIRSQLAGFGGIFALVFLVLRQVHPAFELSGSPYLILLAFLILAMGSAVIALIVNRFGGEMREVKAQGGEVYEADVRRIGAALAAILLGISNLRKRKIRTSLTAATLILLSFTALSFTSVSTSIQFYRLPRGGQAPYEGGLVRERNWKGLQNVALDYVRSSFGQSARVVPRSWYLSPEGKGRSHIHFTGPDTESSSYVFGVVGLSSEEQHVMGIGDLLVGGRWFEPGERDVCILPDDVAALVGIGTADVGAAGIHLLGKEYRVIGIVDADRLNRMRDLDGEKLTPVDMLSESGSRPAQSAELAPAAPMRSFEHLEASNVLLLPYQETMELGGTLRSIAIVDHRGPDFTRKVEAFVTRVAMPTFVGSQGRVTVYTSLGVVALSGLGNLVIPLLIAALIILNTMLGSVYERLGEIRIFSSLGLTPVHVAALFLAEAGVFATVGAVMGYLLGQSLALTLAAAGMLEGVTLNYSSLSAISSTLIVMATVFLSTAYPAKKAADLTVPDVTRKWTFGEPDGDDWSFDFPFTVAGAEVMGLYGYLTEVFESYGEGSIGEFLAEEVDFSVLGGPVDPHYQITLQAWLAPYDQGIAQHVTMEAIAGEHDIFRIAMRIQRLSGEVASWKRINRRFLDVLRKRFLVWRTIPLSARQRFSTEAAARLGVSEREND